MRRGCRILGMKQRDIVLFIIATLTSLIFFEVGRKKELRISSSLVLQPLASHLKRMRLERCRLQRHEDISGMNLTENDFMPYRCYNHNDKYLTALGMHLKDFNRSQLEFKLNGVNLDQLEIYSGHRTFVMNAPINVTMLLPKGNQVFTYKVGNCTFTMNCSNYYDTARDRLNLCVYTKRDLKTITPFLRFYEGFVDRTFIYVTNRTNEKSFNHLIPQKKNFSIIPWYLEDLRDLNISSKVYDELVAHNYRNYSRDAQKVQANDCMYRNRNTNMVLMIDDDEYLNFHNREFFESLYSEVKDEYDDIVLYRNFCNTTVVVETRVSAVLGKSTAQCEKSKIPRLEKAFVLPRNCKLYEIHRCVGANSYSLRHLNVYLAHSPYPKSG